MKLRPSQSSRWMNCPGSVWLAEGVEEKSSSYAVEGSAAHLLIETCQRLDMEPELLLGRTFTLDGGEAVEVDQEMVDCAKVFLEYVEPLTSHKHFIEKWMVSKEYGAMIAGTADFVAVSDETIFVVDYKHGAGVTVNVEGNKQLGIYAMLAEDTFGRRDKIDLTVIQPRSFEDNPVKYWTVDRTWMEQFRVEVHEAVWRVTEAKVNPEANLFPGDHCKFCPVKAVCPKLHQLALADAAADFKTPGISLPNPPELPMERLVFWLEFADLFQEWLKAIQSYAKDLVERGEIVPGWKVVTGLGRRRWSSQEEAIETLVNSGFTMDSLFEEPQLKSPAQMEKLRPAGLKAKEVKELVSTLTERPTTAPTLVRDSDSRAAITRDLPENDFAKVTFDE